VQSEWCSAVQSGAVQSGAVQCSAEWCSAERCSAEQCSAVQCRAVQCRAGISAVLCRVSQRCKLLETTGTGRRAEKEQFIHSTHT